MTLEQDPAAERRANERRSQRAVDAVVDDYLEHLVLEAKLEHVSTLLVGDPGRLAEDVADVRIRGRLLDTYAVCVRLSAPQICPVHRGLRVPRRPRA